MNPESCFLPLNSVYFSVRWKVNVLKWHLIKHIFVLCCVMLSPCWQQSSSHCKHFTVKDLKVRRHSECLKSTFKFSLKSVLKVSETCSSTRCYQFGVVEHFFKLPMMTHILTSHDLTTENEPQILSRLFNFLPLGYDYLQLISYWQTRVPSCTVKYWWFTKMKTSLTPTHSSEIERKIKFPLPSTACTKS